MLLQFLFTKIFHMENAVGFIALYDSAESDLKLIQRTVSTLRLDSQQHVTEKIKSTPQPL